MPDITCPVCGEVNSADQEFCQYCQSRLEPLTGPLKGADAPITPGQHPTKKTTAELEPILPQWLREARDKARKTVEEQAAQEPQPPTPASPPDLLAGLQSQGGHEEEETPDWLASITGAKPKAKKTEAEPTEVHWVELGKPDEFMREQDEETGIPATQEPSASASEGELPPWLSSVQPAQEDGVDELTAWFRQESEGEKPRAEKPAFLTDAGSGPSEAPSKSSEETPDWLKSLQAEQSAQLEIPQAETPLPDTSNADWLKNLQEQQFDAGQESAGGEAPIQGEVPAWLKGDTTPPSETKEVPSWLRGSSPPAFTSEETPSAEEPAGENLPDWLKAAAPQSSVFEEETAAPAPAESPDWLSSLQKEGAASIFEPETPEEGAPPSAFVDESLSNVNTDALFTELPDWLSNVSPAETSATSAEASLTPPAKSAETLEPGDLPSWVQAMRPVESSMAAQQAPASVGGEQPLETRGALAGLHGVLPAMPGAGASSKPKSYSIKLQASEEQQAHAELLEQILAAETAPEPIASFSPLATQRGLRWLLAILLLVTVGAMLFLRTQSFAVPSGETNEIQDARLITEAIPENAPVLVVIDYEPALAGEMEATAAPLLDHAIILKHPILTFISTNPIGGMLAERLFTGPLKDRGYQRGTQYLNLGYLPGGLTGVRAFAQNPAAAVPFDMDLAPAWTGTPLQNVTSLGQFAAMIVITDNAESARTWIEQTADKRPATPLIMVSSAQAAPMIEPYYQSRQVSGMVSGLHDGAIFERNNAGLPGLVRRYWDTFSVGLLLGMVLILGGGLWNLALGLRDRAVAEGK